MRIALFGATGQTGRRVLVLGCSRGWAVSALVRDRSRLAVMPGVDVVEGDARDARSVSETIAGSDGVLVCLGMNDFSIPATDFSDSVKTIVATMRTAKVRRIVAIASALVLPHPGGGLRVDHGVPAILANVAAEHRRNYETLRDSGLEWTLMCPVDLKADIPNGHGRLAYDDLPGGSGETGYDDLAETMVELVDQPASFGRRVGIVSVR